MRERLAFYRRFDLVQTTPELITGALDLHVLHSLSFYDALILQAAATGGCPRLLSEDMQDGAVIAGVTVEPVSGADRLPGPAENDMRRIPVDAALCVTRTATVARALKCCAPACRNSTATTSSTAMVWPWTRRARS